MRGEDEPGADAWSCVGRDAVGGEGAAWAWEVNNVRLRTGTTRLTDLEDACGEALNHFSTAEIQNYMIHGGYRYESVQHALMGAGPR